MCVCIYMIKIVICNGIGRYDLDGENVLSTREFSKLNYNIPSCHGTSIMGPTNSRIVVKR